MAEQYLSDFAKPAINGNVARRVLANEVLRGVTQGVLETNGEGVTQRFSSDTSGAQIRITQFMPFNQEARELGATLNGENFDGRSALQANTNGLGVDVITVINQNIDIPQVTVDMLPIDFLGNCMKNLEMDINNNINAMTIGGKFVSVANDVAEGNQVFSTIKLATATGNEFRQALMNMDARLNAGDADNGLAYFPDDDRCYVFRTEFIPYLFNGGILTLGGANIAYEMLALGGISPNAKRELRSGYVGEFMNKPVYQAAPLIWNLAAKYAGVKAWAINNVYGYLSSGYANVRAIAQADQIKIIDAPDGDGVRIQPNFRMGFKCLYPLGNVFLVEEGFANPADAGELTLKAPGSRTPYSKDATLASVTVGGTAATKDSTYKFSRSVANGVNSAAIVATATAGDKALVQDLGTVDLAVGVNTFTIKVTAEDGSVKNTLLTITRAQG